MRENVRMIHGNSNDPVLIKKISLRVWTLRDEIEAVLKKRWEALDTSSEKPTYQDLLEEYKSSTHFPPGRPTLSIVANEDDMAKAMAETSSEDSAATVENNSDDDQEYEITMRRPALPDDKVASGTTILSEVNMNEIFFFSSKKFIEGQSIVIDFDIPERFSLNADIILCRQFNRKSRIISENPRPYRVLAHFTFIKPGERTLLRNFIESIEPELASNAKMPQGPNKADEIEDLDL